MGLFDHMKLYTEAEVHAVMTSTFRSGDISLILLTLFLVQQLTRLPRVTKKLFIQLYATVLNIIIPNVVNNTELNFHT